MALQSLTEVEFAEVAAADHGRPGLSWAAVLGGALAMIALSLILLSLGVGLGLTSFSAWSGMGSSAATYAISAAVWLIVVQWLSAAFGGYIAGRSRARWNGVHTHESGFRDTLHGFLSWAVATVLTIGLLVVAGGGALSGAIHGAGAVAESGAQMAAAKMGPVADPMALFTDRLFRIEQSNATPAAATVTSATGASGSPAAASEAAPSRVTPQIRDEAGRLLMTQITSGTLSDADKAYLAQEIARVTGIPADEAQKRVADVSQMISDAQTKAKVAAEAARKTAAAGAFFTAFSLLVGAFVAAVAGALGGHQRELNARVRLR